MDNATPTQAINYWWKKSEAVKKENKRLLDMIEGIRQVNSQQTRVLEQIKADVDKFMSLLNISFETHPSVESKSAAFNSYIEGLQFECNRLNGINEQLQHERNQFEDKLKIAERVLQRNTVCQKCQGSKKIGWQQEGCWFCDGTGEDKEVSEALSLIREGREGHKHG